MTATLLQRRVLENLDRGATVSEISTVLNVTVGIVNRSITLLKKKVRTGEFIPPKLPIEMGGLKRD